MSDIVTTQDYFRYYTQKAGDIVRQLGLVGIGAVWTFNSIGGNPIKLDSELKCIVLLICISIAFDVLQYIVGSILWGINWYLDSSKEISKHPITIGIMVFFILIKLSVMCYAYKKLLSFFWANI